VGSGGILYAVICFAGAATVMAAVRAVRDTAEPDFMATLATFRCDPAWHELTFIRELRGHLAEKLKAGPLEKVVTAANLTGTATRIDVHAVYGNVDYFVAVTKDLSVQRVKILTGDVQEILTHVPSAGAKAAVLVVLVYGGANDDGADDRVAKLGDQVLAAAKRWPEIRVHFVGCDSLPRA
jgi:hypothetical protein